MEAKSGNRRNFENGILTDEPELLLPLEKQFDDVWRGHFCSKCARKEYCADCPV